MKALREQLLRLRDQLISTVPENMDSLRGLGESKWREMLRDINWPRPVFVLTLHDNQGGLLVRAARLEKGKDSTIGYYFSTSSQPPAELSRAAGNAVRGLNGFSLQPYSMQSYGDLPAAAYKGEKCLGAWLWSDRLNCGMTLEVPSGEILGGFQNVKYPWLKNGPWMAAFFGMLYLFLALAAAWTVFRGLRRKSSRVLKNGD